MANRWVNEVWWRDWIFWVAAVAAFATLATGLARDGWTWFDLPFRSLYTFIFVVAVLGFVRTVVRTYRAPASEDGSID
jgi:hypothetical protein